MGVRLLSGGKPSAAFTHAAGKLSDFAGAEEAAGGIRNQFHHVIDVMPMIFDAIGRAARYQGLTLRHGDALPALPNNAAAQANPTLNNVIPEFAAVTVHAKITAIEVTGAISM